MSDPIRHNDDAIPEPTQRLSDDLRAAYASEVPVPADVDRAVATMAQRRFAGVRRRRILLRRVGAALATGAAAASIVLVAWLGWTGDEPAASVLVASREGASRSAPEEGAGRPGASVATPSMRVAAARREDVDGNGRVDIRDALRLARRLERGEPTEPVWDVNGDGTIDRTDVDAVAKAAVRLDSRVIQ